MLKLQLSLLIGDDEGNKETWYCRDKNTNKFYRKTTVKSGNDITVTIEEIPEEVAENYFFQNQKGILGAMNKK